MKYINSEKLIAYLNKTMESYKSQMVDSPKFPDNMIQWTGNNLKEVIDFTGKSPKFGEWFKSWEEFESYVHSHGDILKLFSEDGSHFEVPVGAWIVKTPDGYNVPSVARFIHAKQEQPHLPSNLDEAAEKSGLEYAPIISGEALDLSGQVYETDDVNWPDRCGFIKGFKAGAEWMVKQGRVADASKMMKQSGVDLQKEIDKEWEKCNPIDEGMGVEMAYIHIEEFDMIARHFYELGITARKEE